MGDRESDAGFEGADGECAFAVARAAGDGDFGGVDVCGGSDFEDVDDAGDAPCPGDHGRCVVGGPVEVVEEALATAAGVGLLGDVIVVVV